MKILIAEDNNNLRELMTDYLEVNGYEIGAFANGVDAYESFLTEQYDLALLDVMMPEMDGFELCEKIKTVSDLPVLFLTAKVTENDQLHGYELGCDDYIIKPFSLPVLVAKIKVLLSRKAKPVRQLSCGSLILDYDQQTITVDGTITDLQSLDFQLLEYFMKHPDRILSREQILSAVWGYDFEGNDRSVDTHVKNLRKILKPYDKCIKTVIKRGYRFETKGTKL